MALLPSPGVKLTPSPTIEVTSTNYVSTFDFSDENIPDLVREEFQRYGNQSIKGFLERVGSEVPSSADLVKWSEEGRLRNVGKDLTRTANVFDFVGHPFRVNETVLFNDGTNEDVGHVTAITDDTFTAVSTKAGGFDIGLTGIDCFVIGSEFAKGTNGMQISKEAVPDIYENSPVIIKDLDTVNGSDASNIGWIEVPSEEGSGYLWYLKSRSETRQRFDDYLEMSMIEGRSVDTGSDAASANKKGTEGFFEAIEKGNIFSGVADTLEEWDEIIHRLDAQGHVQENMVFTNRSQSLAIDDFLASLNNTTDSSYGVFNNQEEMALNLGFKGFMRGEYDFYKTSWKYLNDPTTRGAFTGTSKVNAVLAPAGTTNVYDEIMGERTNLPFLHCKYKSAGAEDRRYKTWMVGGAVGASNSDLDANNLHFLSERCLCTMGRNNFFKFVG